MQKIIKEWQAKRFHKFYWLEGEEPYFLDKLADYAEQNIIEEDAKIFDQVVLYGADVNLNSMLMQCRTLPVYGEWRLILLKEAQDFKDAEKFCQKFTPSSDKVIVIVVRKPKKDDSKNKKNEIKAELKKHIQEIGVYFCAKKIYENRLPDWIIQNLSERKLRISPEALFLLIESVGVDLYRLENELQKLALNLSQGAEIDADMICRYIGISREYNVFELQKAISTRNVKICLQIMRYISENSKDTPFILLVKNLHEYFLKLLLYKQLHTQLPSAELAKTIGVHSFFLKEYQQAARFYTDSSIEEAIQILTEYHLRHLGISKSKQIGEPALAKECLTKIMLTLHLA